MKLTDSLCAGTLSLLLAAMAGEAHADTLWREAESMRGNRMNGTITSPMQIKDSTAASNGGYIEVEPGKNSTGSMPSVGKACIQFSVAAAGNYRVWARVIAATTSDDSFWVQMDGATPINWQLSLGTSWHWNQVRQSGASAASVFNLTAANHDLCFGFREDGSKLDAVIITSDAAFNPDVAPAGPPAAPADYAMIGDPKVVLVSWAMSLGAESYRVERQLPLDPATNEPGYETVATTGASQFSLIDNAPLANPGCYRVIAVNAAGQSGTSAYACATIGTHYTLMTETSAFTLTSPMRQGVDAKSYGLIEVTPGNNSTSAAPATGWARYDFRLAAARSVNIWAMVAAASASDDSYWVRMDFGPWINWNNWKITYKTTLCQWDPIHNSATDSKPVVYNLGPGNHTLEFAYREDGAQLFKVAVESDPAASLAGCFD